MAYKEKVVIGDCTLYLGDCRDVIGHVGDWHSIVSDPPYGMSFVSNHRSKKHKAIENDDDVCLLKWCCELIASHSKYIFCRWDNLPDVPPPKSFITWVKNNHSMGDLEHEHGRKTEGILFYDGEEHKWPDGRPNDVVKNNRTGNNLHPTEKPIDLMCQVCGWTSGTIMDPFMGSGSTLVAAAKMRRKAIGIEIDPNYFSIAVERVRQEYSQGDLFYG